MLLALLGDFRPFSLGIRMQFDPGCFFGSTQSRLRMGHGLGQAEIALLQSEQQDKTRTLLPETGTLR